MTKQVLITGGVGFIGHHLVEKLIKENYYPIIIDNFFNADVKNIKHLSSNKYALINLDINNSMLEKKLKNFKPETTVHLAAIHYIPYCVKHPKKTLKTNFIGTKKILELSRKLNVKKFIFSSSAAVYKPSKIAHKENDLIKPIDVYGRTKVISEKLIENFCSENNMQFFILRFFNIYGEKNLTPHFIPSLIEKIKKSKNIKLGNIDTCRDYIYIDDIIEIVSKIIKIKKEKGGIYNIGTGHKYSGKDIILLVENILNQKIKINKDEELVRKNDRKFLVANIDKIKKAYNWQPTFSLRDGLKKLIKNNE